MAQAIDFKNIDWSDKRLWVVGGVIALGTGYLISDALTSSKGSSSGLPPADTIVGGTPRTSAKGDVYYPAPTTTAQKNANLRAAYKMVDRVVKAGVFGGGSTLPMLAVIWAIGESGGRPNACKRAQGSGFRENGARGFYQGRPKTSYDVDSMSDISNAQLKALCSNLPVQTALWLGVRREQYDRLRSGQQMTAIAARAGGAGGSYIPSFADGDYSKRPKTITRFEKAYDRALAKGYSLPDNWEVYADRVIPLRSWPGRREVGKILGVRSSDLKLL